MAQVPSESSAQRASHSSPAHDPDPAALTSLQQVLNESGPRAQGRAPSPPLRVVPLFETLSDLEASRSVMQSLYR